MRLRAIESKWKAFTDGLRSRSDVETAGIILAKRLKGGEVLLVPLCAATLCAVVSITAL